MLVKNSRCHVDQMHADGKSEIRFKPYYKQGDSLVLTYDPVSKLPLGGTIISDLGSPKDPVTVEAVFETLPDGVNHLVSATLNAKAKNVQVKATNSNYQKLAN